MLMLLLLQSPVVTLVSTEYMTWPQPVPAHTKKNTVNGLSIFLYVPNSSLEGDLLAAAKAVRKMMSYGPSVLEVHAAIKKTTCASETC